MGSSSAEAGQVWIDLLLLNHFMIALVRQVEQLDRNREFKLEGFGWVWFTVFQTERFELLCDLSLR